MHYIAIAIAIHIRHYIHSCICLLVIYRLCMYSKLFMQLIAASAAATTAVDDNV